MSDSGKTNLSLAEVIDQIIKKTGPEIDQQFIQFPPKIIIQSNTMDEARKILFEGLFETDLGSVNMERGGGL